MDLSLVKVEVAAALLMDSAGTLVLSGPLFMGSVGRVASAPLTAHGFSC